MLGSAVRHLRRMAAAGASTAELDAFLEMRNFGEWWGNYRYLDRAFLQHKLFMYTIQAKPEHTYANWEPLVAQHRDKWLTDRVAELMRLRDYFSFMQFAQEQQVSVLVCGANPAAGQWIGKPGVRCYDGDLPLLSRETEPNAGLLAADPNDATLAEMLQLFEPRLSYAEYVNLLHTRGLHVSSAAEGYLVADRQGQRFHESYRLHGVYRAKTHVPVWTSKTGENLRAALNRHLGAELVRWGPHDTWEFRNQARIAGPLFGPLLPVLAFNEDQHFEEKLIRRKLATGPYRQRWDDLFPHHPPEPHQWQT